MSDGFFVVVGGEWFAVVFVVAFGGGCAFAFDCGGYDAAGAGAGFTRIVECGAQECHVVSVYFVYFPAEAFEFGGYGEEGHDVVDGAVDLEGIGIDYGGEVFELVFCGGHGGFPILPFLEFAIAEDAIYMILLVIQM